MSDQNNIPNEEELWDLLSDPAAAGAKPEKAPKAPKSGPKFAKPRSERTAAPADHSRTRRKIDGFFLGCMAGVAAVSVAATLLLSGALAGDPKPTAGNPVVQNPAAGETISQQVQELERENAQLRAQLEQQKTQIKDLQADLLKLMGSEEYLSTIPSDPEDSNDVIDAQVEAYAIFAQIQEAYADFDRAKLEELIPEMDARLNYLSSETLNQYYLILEYMEQPSNG